MSCFAFPTEVVREGKVRILVPELEAFVEESWEYAPSRAPVFYNPLMEMNRDLAVLALQAYQRKLRRAILACEPLSGCGVRGVRLAVEVEGVRKVVINDISPEAARLGKFNVDLNNLQGRVHVENKDANLLLCEHAAPRKRFDYVDVDPFGSPAPYMDTAVRALRSGGLLALTATDMAPLCGVYPRSCLRKYGGRPLRTEYCHEIALRLLIGSLATTAAKHDIGIQPVFSCRTYNHVRTYVIVNYGAKQADSSIRQMGLVFHCFACLHRETAIGISPSLKRECPECSQELGVAGPLWLGPLWNKEFCSQMRNEMKNKDVSRRKELLKLLFLSIREAEASVTYYVADKICDKYDVRIPSLSKIIYELRLAGYEGVATSFNSRGFRTDASAGVVKEIVLKLSLLQSKK